MKNDRLCKLFILLLLPSIFVAFPFFSSAKTYTWISDVPGDWSDKNNWFAPGPSSIPGNNDQVEFVGTNVGDCTIDIPIEIKKLLVKSGYTGQIIQNSTMNIGNLGADFSGGAFLGGSDFIQIQNHLTISGTNFTSTTGPLLIFGDYTFSSGNFNHQNGSVRFTSITNQISGSTTFNNVIFLSTSPNTYNIASGTILTVLGNLTLNGTGRTTLNGGEIHAAGDITITNTGTNGGGGTLITINGSGDQLVTGSGNVEQGSLPNVIIDKPSGILTFSGLISVRGDWTFVSLGTGSLVSAGGIVAFLKDKTIEGSHELDNVEFVGNGGSQFDIAAGTILTVPAQLTISGNGTVLLNTGTIDAQGNINISNFATGGGGSATMNIKGSGNQLLVGTSTIGEGALPNIVIDKGGGTLTIFNTISVAGNWTYIDGTIDASTNASTIAFIATLGLDGQGPSGAMAFHHVNIESNITLGGDFVGNGDLTINASSILNTSGSNYAVNVGGNWLNNGDFTENNGSVTFTGSGNQTLTNGAGETYYDLTINKTGGNVILNSPVRVDNSLTLTNLNIITSSTNMLTLSDNATTSGASDASFVDGPVTKEGDDEYTFPLGGSGFFHPLLISAPPATTDVYRAEYLDVGQTISSNFDASLASISNCEYWTMERLSGTTDVQVAIGWKSSSCNVDNIFDLTMAVWDGSLWSNVGHGEMQGNLDQGSLGPSDPLDLSLYPSPVSLLLANEPGSVWYPKLEKRLDGGHYLVIGGKLFFRYEEEYNVVSGSKLTYNIYDDTRTLVGQVDNSGTIIITGSPNPGVQYGDNRYGVNSGFEMDLSTLSLTADDFYTLEVINKKGESWYLRFKYRT